MRHGSRLYIRIRISDLVKNARLWGLDKIFHRLAKRMLCQSASPAARRTTR